MKLLHDTDTDCGILYKYKLDDDREISIELIDYDFSIVIRDINNEEIGLFKFDEVDVSCSEVGYKIIHMNLTDDSFKRKGIGRICLKKFKFRYGGNLYASANDGMKLEDGSHLTGDAPAFIQKMRKENIVEKLPL